MTVPYAQRFYQLPISPDCVFDASPVPGTLGRLRQNSDAAKQKHGRARASLTSHRLFLLGHHLVPPLARVGVKAFVNQEWSRIIEFC